MDARLNKIQQIISELDGISIETPFSSDSDFNIVGKIKVSIDLFNFDLELGKQKPYIALSYQVFGQPIGSSPIIVINHALTGNSNIGGNDGWWKEIVGKDKPIDTNYFTIIAFNIPGNGYDGDVSNLIDNYRDYTVRDIARIFWEGLSFLKVENIHALIDHY